MNHSRRVPFSGKKKRQQLRERRLRKAAKNDVEAEQKEECTSFGSRKNKEYTRPSDKLATVFEKESKETIEERKRSARRPVVRLPCKQTPKFCTQVIDIPKRPAWNYSMSKEEIESQENAMFQKYIDGIYSRVSVDQLNYFEHNLEVWRQLWRVCELADILLVLADIRHPLLHFPIALYHYIVQKLKKPLILVLTKIDLVSSDAYEQWIRFFAAELPEVKVCGYRFYRGASDVSTAQNKAPQRKYQSVDVSELMEHIKSLNIIKNGRLVPIDYQGYRVPPPSPAEDIKSDPDDGDSKKERNEESDLEALDLNQDRLVKEANYIILGLVGNPNVGKSTFINALKGRKVCSVSRTPGHTKWKQTIFLTKNLMLVDCPGLVFPAIGMPKELQILCGLFPIAQVREPYSAIQYAAQYLPFEDLYKLKLDDTSETTNPDMVWSAWTIVEAYANRRGYRTSKGRLDTHRAGTEILYDIIDGKVVLSLFPPSDQFGNADSFRALLDPKRMFNPLYEEN